MKVKKTTTNFYLIEKYVPKSYRFPFLGTEKGYKKYKELHPEFSSKDFKDLYHKFSSKDFKDPQPEYSSKDFKDLLRKNNLLNNYDDLYLFAWFYSDMYYWLDNLVKLRIRKPSQPTHHNRELKDLGKFLSKQDIISITLVSKRGETQTIKSNLLLDISLLLYGYTRNAIIEEERPGEERAFKKLFPQERSIMKEFAHSLKGLYNYLREETCLNNSSNEDIYRFIGDFCEILGISKLPSELRKYVK